MSMNKAAFIKRMSITGAVTQLAAREAYDMFTATLVAEMQCNEAVLLPELGKFESRAMPERQGRNPSTGESLTIQAKNAPKFKPSVALKEVLNA